MNDILKKLEDTPVLGVTITCCLNVICILKEQGVFTMEDELKADVLEKLMIFKGTVVYPC